MRRTPLQRKPFRVIRDLEAEAAWAERRAEVWRRDAGRCCLCRRDVTLDGCDIHHRKLKKRGGTDDHENLVTLCRRCHHERVHRFPVWATVTGWQVPSWTTPVAWPALYAFDDWAAPLWAVPAQVNGVWSWVTAAPHADQHDEPGPWAAA